MPARSPVLGWEVARRGPRCQSGTRTAAQPELGFDLLNTGNAVEKGLDYLKAPLYPRNEG